MILVDTNILARLPNGADTLRDAAKAALVRMLRRPEKLVIAPQCLYEFWVVMTRPPQENGYGFTPARAGRWLHRIRNLATLLPDDIAICQRWENLVTTQNVIGKKGHDAHLVAWMQHHGVGSILTFNTGDFGRYGITVIDPKTLPPN
jgi:predicted nucleic acid-binding protein